MDYETLPNCFIGVFEHFKTDNTHVFIISEFQNDLPHFLDFLQQNIQNNEWHVSFNGLNFDAQITQFILVKRKKLLRMSGMDIANAIHKEATEVIGRSRNREFQKYPEYKLSIKQIDVFKLNHWDNRARQSSLKWIQCSMRWPNVQDMPLDPNDLVLDVETQREVEMYCRNDVASTKNIMAISKQQIALRGTLTKKYGIRLYSASEARIAKEIFAHYLAKAMNIKKYRLKKMRTYRSLIDVERLILDYVQFTTPEFQKLLANFKALKLDPEELKGQFKDRVQYRGVRTDFGLGGVHGAKRGIYEPPEHMILMSSDVVSYYPNLAIRNQWAPAHLPKKIFCSLYERFFNDRKKIPKSNPQNYVLKIILNSTYGLSNDVHSFLYDPEFTMRITVNGQLSLMMLYEQVVEQIPGAVPIMQNTDGIEVMIPKRYKDKYLEICDQWELTTNLKLEHDEYQKLIVPDVNNYIGVFAFKEVDRNAYLKSMKSNPDNVYKVENGKFYVAKTKAKGRFEIDKALHKNHSFMVVVKALFYHFVHGIKPEEYIKTNTDILDYCGLTRTNKDWRFEHTFMKDGEIHTEKLQKTIRYYVSKEGTRIVKKHKTDGRQNFVDAGPWVHTIFNVYEHRPFEEYGVDYRFYLEKINSEIRGMQPKAYSKQTSLF